MLITKPELYKRAGWQNFTSQLDGGISKGSLMEKVANVASYH